MAWTASERAYLLREYRTLRLAEIARHLGKDRRAVVGEFGRLVVRGLAERTRRAYQPPWSPAELAWARDRLGRPGWTLATVAAKLGRSENGVKIKLTRSGICQPVTGKTAQAMRLRDLMAVMGLGGNHDRARGWITAGLLKAQRLGVRGPRPIYAIYAGDLVEFLKRHPEAYDYARIPATLHGKPNPYRTHARPGPGSASGYLPAKQAARALGVAHETYRRWCREGRISEAVHLTGRDMHPGEWWLRKSDLPGLLARRVRMKNGWFTLPSSDFGTQSRKESQG